jgi:hypothetical protein
VAVFCRAAYAAGQFSAGRRAGSYCSGAASESMRYTPLIFGVLAATCGVAAAFFGYRASTTPVQPPWELDPELNPKNMQEEAWGLAHALEAAMFWSGRSSKFAAYLGAAAGVFALLSAVFGILG